MGFGLRPTRHLSGSPYNGQFNEYVHLAADGAALFIGSPVKLTGTLGADPDGVELPVVALAAPGDAMVGVVVGVKPITADSTKYVVASTLRVVYVADDPKLIFEIEEDGVGGVIADASAGLNADHTAESGSTVTGYSTVQLDSSDVAALTTGQLRIHRLSKKVGNLQGTTSPLTIWEVIIGEHQLMEATAQIGTDI